MNDPRNSSDYESQLAALENRLKSRDGDEAILGDVGVAMRYLLTENDGSEARIRQILERQFDQGNLRKESYELVEKLLQKIAEESRIPPPTATGIHTWWKTPMCASSSRTRTPYSLQKRNR